MQALMRRFANDESLFQQRIAVRGDGDCLLAPTLDGDMMILDVGAVQYTLSDGAFVAGTSGMDVKAKIQTNLGGALFGDTGGFYGHANPRSRTGCGIGLLVRCLNCK